MILRITYITTIAAVLSTIVLVVLTHIPGDSIPSSVRYNDKMMHFVAYALVSLLYGVSFAVTGRKGLWRLLIISIFMVILGAADEYTQQFFGRHTDLLDYYADLCGIALGMGISFVFWIIKTIFALRVKVTISK